jgi:hypothetical protein
MNYQGVMSQEIFLGRHYTNRAAALAAESGDATVAGLENYILNSARARIQNLRRHRSVYIDEGALKDADPPKKTEAEREAIKAGIRVIVPIEDTADLML